METFDMTVLLEDFVDTASEHLDAVEVSLMKVEENSSLGVLDEGNLTLLLGNLHTLKGNSGMMGFGQLSHFIHKLESVLKEITGNSATIEPRFFETLYSSINSIRDALRRLADDPHAVIDFTDELMLLECLGIMEPNIGNESALTGRKEDFGYVMQKSNTLKVNFEKLDELMNLVGELVVHRTTLLSLESKIKETVKERTLVEAFDQSGQAIAKTANDLREAIMKVRMLPVHAVFQRFSRLVRDLSRTHGKDIKLVFQGGETELDKTIIDEIGEPLLHLIRNAVDHGIENPAERKRQGKPAAGTLTLRAGHESNHIVIMVEDDGRGMSADHLRNSALAKGLITPREAREMGDLEAMQLVFMPGFSTSHEVTETSGRGIGLDVVRKIVSSFNGIIEIDSAPGIFTRFTMKLPLTLAIIQSLMVEAAGETFAIPLSGVVESLKVEAAGIHAVGAGEMIRLRDRLLPIVRLNRFFSLENGEERDMEYVVVVGNGEKRGGIVVDRLIGQQEIVIKGMDDYLGDLPGIAGGTILGDGKVALIIDIASLIGTTKGGGPNDRNC